MTATATWRRYARFQADWRALGLVCLFTFVLFAAAAASSFFLEAPDMQPVTESTTTAQQAATGIGASIFTVIEASILLGIALLYRKTPEWLQPVIKRTIATAFWIGVGLVAALTLGIPAGFASAAIAYFGVHAVDALGVYWVLNNLFAVGLAIYFAAAVGVLAGPIVFGVALVGLSVYDHVFANRKNWMFTLARGAVRWRLPGLVVIPTTWRLPWGELAEFTTDKEDSPIGFGIGMADLALPSAFVVALLVHSTSLLAVGAAAGVLLACLHLSWSIEHSGSGAGLPPLAAGAIGGLAVAGTLGVVV